MKEIFIIVDYPPTETDFKKYGYTILKENNIDVIWGSVSNIMFPVLKLNKKNSITSEVIFFDKISELRKYLMNQKHNFTIVTGLTINTRTYWLYKLFTELNIEYILLDLWYLPFNKKMLVKEKFKLFFSKTIFKKLEERFFKVKINKYIKKMKKAKIVTLSSQKSSENSNILKHTNSHTEIIPFHVSDYDYFLQFKEKHIVHGDYYVFLDQFLEGHLDFIRSKKKFPVDKEYLRKLNNFFPFFEKITKAKVVIAAHPRRPEGNNPLNRKIFYNSTMNLIYYSKGVIVHNSISLHLAIILKKEILFLAEKSMAKDFIKKIKYFSNLLNSKIYYMNYEDKDYLLQCLKIENSIYGKYIDNYIKMKDSLKITIAELLIRILRKEIKK